MDQPPTLLLLNQAQEAIDAGLLGRIHADASKQT
jgi:hypothetical protein